MRASKNFSVGGTGNIQVLWEVFNLFNTENYSQFSDAAYAFIGTPAYDAATNLLTVNLREDPGYLGRAQRHLELLGHARHAARFEVPLVGC